MDLGLAGAAAAVTGGTKGMGRAIAECFADEGARIAVLARSASELEGTVAALRERGAPDAAGISTDVSDPVQIDAAFAQIAERWGSLNALVNNVDGGSDFM